MPFSSYLHGIKRTDSYNFMLKGETLESRHLCSRDISDALETKCRFRLENIELHGSSKEDRRSKLVGEKIQGKRGTTRDREHMRNRSSVISLIEHTMIAEKHCR